MKTTTTTTTTKAQTTRRPRSSRARRRLPMAPCTTSPRPSRQEAGSRGCLGGARPRGTSGARIARSARGVRVSGSACGLWQARADPGGVGCRGGFRGRCYDTNTRPGEEEAAAAERREGPRGQRGPVDRPRPVGWRVLFAICSGHGGPAGRGPTSRGSVLARHGRGGRGRGRLDPARTSPARGATVTESVAFGSRLWKNARGSPRPASLNDR